MAELFLELISEQIPSRFQKFGAETLSKELLKNLASLSPKISKLISDPRRIGCVVTLKESTPEENNILRGPKLSAPAKALEGFSRKCGVSPEALEKDETHYFFKEYVPARSAVDMIAETLPALLWEFPWPKAMRWGGTSRFPWVRPLHKIVCLLDGRLIDFSLERDGDDAHGLKSGIWSEDGPFGYQEVFKVTSADQWEKQLRSKGLVPFHAERFKNVKASLEKAAQANDLTVILNDGLLNEVTGLCEIPVAYLGKIDPAHMELPHEVRDDLMGEHQRYFPVAKKDGSIAPYFAFVANHPFEDNELVSHGNERVLRARLEDGRHFWNQDRKKSLASRVDDLEKMTFQEGLGTQKDRAYRLEKLSGELAKKLGYDEAVQKKAARAGLLLKADLVTEMVGELPSLQGIMGGYYAEHDGEDKEIAQAIKQQYLPKGNSSTLPIGDIAAITALADRLDTLAGFFSIGLTPTGSGDPFGLRRVALGIFRISQDAKRALSNHELLSQMDFRELLKMALKGISKAENPSLPKGLEDFIIDRLRVQLRQNNIDTGIPEALFSTSKLAGTIFEQADFLQNAEHNITGYLEFLDAYRRANNILQAEIKKGWKAGNNFNEKFLRETAEQRLSIALNHCKEIISSTFQARISAFDIFESNIHSLVETGEAIRRFFEEVLVNDPDPDIRNNRLLLISAFIDMCNQVADFSKIEKKS